MGLKKNNVSSPQIYFLLTSCCDNLLHGFILLNKARAGQSAHDFKCLNDVLQKMKQSWKKSVKDENIYFVYILLLNDVANLLHGSMRFNKIIDKRARRSECP